MIQTTISDDTIFDYLREKWAGWSPYIMPKMPPLSTLSHTAFLGSFSWTMPKPKIRYVLRQHAVTWLRWDTPVTTPSGLARAYLDQKYTLPLRCTTAQYHALVRQQRKAPLWADVGELSDAVYVDLKAAFWQILLTVGWNVEYLPGVYLAPRSDVSDFPYADNKLARNTLVSIGLPGQMSLFIPGTGLVTRRKGGKYTNLVLWGLVQDVLNGFAWDMILNAGAVYVNTDGYIVPSSNANIAYELADSWGLVLTERHRGRAIVRGAGDYDIGARRSRRPRTRPQSHHAVTPVEHDWLRGKYRRAAERSGTAYKLVK